MRGSETISLLVVCFVLQVHFILMEGDLLFHDAIDMRISGLNQ
jgi:hypothetical protein